MTLSPSLLLASLALSASPLIGPGVPRDLAKWRAAHYHDIRYKLSFNIAPMAPRLDGTETITVSIDNPADDLILDWRVAPGTEDNGLPNGAAVNGRPIAHLKRINDHIIIPAGYLMPGVNSITLEFSSPISTSGSAVTRYLDREDGNEYVYTLFVPSDASTTFPCFDQPDLKARFTLELTVPARWQAISNTAPITVPITVRDDRAREMKQWEFAQTEPISTYLFAFAAGPFQELTDKASPLGTRLFVRASKLEKARAEAPEVFRIVREGLAYFIDYFHHQYPFPKYDLVLIPEFAYGGMEHAGATFLNEDGIIFPSEPTASNYLSRADLLLHETAHQWFGDLVTMRWFDDLWLKEGFATFMAAKAAERVMPGYDVWKWFFLTTKPLAYATDVTKGTTPIFQEIPNLSAAKSAYGNIVYDKAPSMLRQAEFYLGPENFQKAIQLFVGQHAFSNADWADLVGDFETTSGLKLAGWADAWVKRRGMPEVSVQWRAGPGHKITRFSVSQRDVLGEGGVWPMKTEVLLEYQGREPKVLTVTLNGRTTLVPEAIGLPAPDLVFANYHDYGYGWFVLDPKSRRAAQEMLGNIEDDFLRALLWGSLWQAVLDSTLPPRSYIDLALKLVPIETDDIAAQSLLERTAYSFNHYLSRAQQKELAGRIEESLRAGMLGAPAKGLRITYFRALRDSASGPMGRASLEDLFSGKLQIPGVALKSRDRFDIVTRLMSLGDPSAGSLLEQASRADQTDNGRRYRFAAAAAEPDPKVKKEYFSRFLGDPDLPESWIEASLGPFNSIEQQDLTLSYLRPALEALPSLKRKRKIFFVNRWLAAFIGGQNSPRALLIVNDFLARPGLDADLRRKVLEVMDGLNRSVRIRHRYVNGR